MKVQILQSGIKEKVRKDDELMLKLAKANGVRVDSVLRWIKTDSKLLTTATNLKIIREHLEIPESEEMTIEDDILA